MGIKNSFIALALGVVVLGAAAAWYWSQLPTVSETTTITLPSATLQVEVVDTPAERERGLSGHRPLSSGEGMLFVFESDGLWGIWMKDMQFNIDIVWLNAEGRVVTVEGNVSPDSYPRVFTPAAPARYVLELPANAAEAYDLVVGAKVML